MAKMTGLGKGLDALFGGAPLDIEINETENIDKENLKTLKITEVEPNREQPRKTFKQESLEELAESIKTYGIIQPIVVSKRDGYYGIVAGERRWRAAKLAGLEEIPAIIRKDETENSNVRKLLNAMTSERGQNIAKEAGYVQNY